MNRKLKIQPSLAGLTPDQFEQLADWLDHHTFEKTIELAAQPSPEGLGRKLTIGVLQRYRNKIETMRDLFEERVAFQVALREYFALRNGEPTSLDPEGLKLIKERAFELALQKDQTPARLKDLMRIFDYDRRVQIEANREARADRRDARAERADARAEQKSINRSSRREEAHSISPHAHDAPAPQENRTPAAQHSGINLKPIKLTDTITLYPNLNPKSIIEWNDNIAFQDIEDPVFLEHQRAKWARMGIPQELWAHQHKLLREQKSRSLRRLSESALAAAAQNTPQENPAPALAHCPSSIAHENSSSVPSATSAPSSSVAVRQHLSSAPTTTHNPSLPACPATTHLRQVLECGGIPPLSSAPTATHNPPLASCPSTPSTPQENPAALAHCPSSIAHENSPSVPTVSPENSASNELAPSGPAPAAPSGPAPAAPNSHAQAHAYTRARAREFSTKTCTPSAFVTTLKHCPCGQDLPCPDHAPASNPFPKLFWHISPEDPDYTRELIKRGLYPDPARDSAAQAQAAKLKARVQEYTDFRNNEYEYLGWNDYYVTTLQYCPCGHGLPCPAHAPENNPFSDAFWSASVYDPEYAEGLVSHGLPYTRPSESAQQAA